MRPVDAGYISYAALKDGSIDLADIARMNDWLDLKADNNARIRRWEQDNQ
ncbi:MULTISPECIES: NTP pyrophosphohydrolase [Pantoea]|nr:MULTISPECIES: NTP pyrophosphohydrolase [Pantoea]RBO14349.1 NTP pyrophosphohydrolase [Pantoea sp. 3_1284]